MPPRKAPKAKAIAANASGTADRKVALVTGASRGIGRAIAEALAREGIYVFVNFHSSAKEASECISAIKLAGGDGEIIRADVSHEGQVRQMFKTIAQRAGRLDILVGNAGVAPVVQDFERLTMKAWTQTFAVNVVGAFLCAREALPLLKRSPAGRIIFIGSAAARLGGNIGAHYAASKAAISGLVEYLSRTVGRYRITVNIVEPGFVRTELSAKFHRNKAVVRSMSKSVPLGRVGSVAEIADGVAFLAGDAAAYITRQNLAITGGR
jgi:3-oxoacyl-[acyl-carrier protein] reductase